MMLIKHDQGALDCSLNAMVAQSDVAEEFLDKVWVCGKVQIAKKLPSLLSNLLPYHEMLTLKETKINFPTHVTTLVDKGTLDDDG